MSTNSSAVIIPAPLSATNSAATNTLAGSDLRDIKGPVHISNGWVWLWWTLGAVAVAALACLALRRWLKRPKVKPPEIIVPPHERARRKLQEALDFIDQPRWFCILVSDTLRVYLEERFDLRAPERTTEEFLQELQSSPLLSFSQMQSLGDFLMRCDFVKFARYEPGEPELRQLHEAAVRLVDETAPVRALASIAAGTIHAAPSVTTAAPPSNSAPAVSGQPESSESATSGAAGGRKT
jgi:hypothetical protein